MNAIDFAEKGWIPDRLIRMGIRRLLDRRKTELGKVEPAERAYQIKRFSRELRRSPLAVATAEANQQHYEVSADFFVKVLAPRLKYSSSYFVTPQTSLEDAEEEMLQLTCDRAEIDDGMQILELGCGWGSLTLWMAERFPNCRITAVSNSESQGEYIEGRTKASGYPHVNVVTADMCEFRTDQSFDRVVSVEMFEHMRNYELLLRRVSQWLTPSGKAFVHIFCHRDTPYLFETEGTANWMGRNFFTGGMMPSEGLLSHFDDDLEIEKQWRVAGLHYWKTCEAWLSNLDRHRDTILASFQRNLSAREARIALQRWRIFFMACAELFRTNDGTEWFVAHYLLTHKGAAKSGATTSQLQHAN